MSMMECTTIIDRSVTLDNSTMRSRRNGVWLYPIRSQHLSSSVVGQQCVIDGLPYSLTRANSTLRTSLHTKFRCRRSLPDGFTGPSKHRIGQVRDFDCIPPQKSPDINCLKE